MNFGEVFRVLHSRLWVSESEISRKIHAKNGAKNGKFHANFTLRNNRKGGTASLYPRTCVKRNAVFAARFKGLSLYFLYQKGNRIRIKTNLIRIKTGLDTYLIRVQTSNPLSPYPPYDYSRLHWGVALKNSLELVC